MAGFLTARMAIRPLGEARDALVLALPQILSAQVLAPLPPSLGFARGDDPEAWIEARGRESDLLVVTDRTDGQVIGLILLAPGENNVVHLGYLLGKAPWGHGLASEMLAGLVKWFRDRAPVTLVGGVARDNPASARVLEKVGFRPMDGGRDGQTLLYRLEIG